MTAMPENGVRTRDAEAIADVPRWYHSIQVSPGVVTPGVFDLRPIVDKLPWPDVTGKRCLDVGTSDGFLAFEAERRGAAEVVALDIGAHEQWDWEEDVREQGPEYLRQVVGPMPGRGFKLARELLGSSVRLEHGSVYELDPSSLGTFDVVICGSLLLHLRDPLRALAAIRRVSDGHLLSTNQIDLGRSILFRRQPLVRLDGTSGVTQWWIPNVAGHRQMLRAAGFDIERESVTYAIPFGPAHPRPSRSPRQLMIRLGRRLLARGEGVPHHAVLARPRD